MIKFKTLKVKGFKSFVEPTEIIIEQGLTGIVGPNGCGKSNLVEAFRFVMGELSPKQMRGSELDDVIFNVLPPSSYDLNMHKDWNEGYGNKLFNGQIFRYSNVDFEEIAKANRD